MLLNENNIYSGLFGSVVEIYRQNGLLGFFSGLIPRLLGEIISLLLAHALSYVINTYIFEDKDLQTYTTATTSVCFLWILELDLSSELKNELRHFCWSYHFTKFCAVRQSRLERLEFSLILRLVEAMISTEQVFWPQTDVVLNTC